MMLELLQKRRSIRQFTDQKVEQEKVDILLEAALRSPTSKNSRPWEFIVVNTPELMEKLSTAKEYGAAFAKHAPLALVVCADPEKSAIWIEDCAIAALIIHLTATDLGLGSCWVHIRERRRADGTLAADYLKEELGVAAEKEILAFVAIGYAKEEKPGHDRQKLLYERVSYAS